jgi:alkylation response protein AidB-like acyl-CoA dehydrogenase
MDFGLSEDQEMLKTMARDFLAKENPKTYVRKMMTDETGYSPDLWKKIADLGWLGLVFPEQYGGAEMNFRDLAILAEEMGRSLLAAPYLSTVLLVGFPILNFGSEELKKEFLPKISKGEITATLAALEEDGDLWAGAINTKATRNGNNYTIKGTKFFVTDAKAADYYLVAARTQRSANPEDGITLFMVDAQEWGVYASSLKAVDEIRKQYEVSFKNVSVPASNIVGELNNGWPILQDIMLKTNAILCAEMVGGCDWVIETTVAYTKDRQAYGVPIGSFQALKHQMADMYSAVEHARPLMIRAVEAIKDGSPDAVMAVSMAKSFCSDAYKYISDRGVQLHGGIGFTWDHDMHLYFKRARLDAEFFGNSTYHRELVAQILS